MRLKNLLVLVVALGLFVVAGCSKVSQDNYDKINTGMTVDEVEGILGGGTVEGGGGVAVGDVDLSGKVMKWGDDAKHIKVTFANSKVVAKSKVGF